MKPDFEDRLDSLRHEARERGSVRGRGVDVAGGPIPVQPAKLLPGYAGEPIVRPHVWSWEISVYFYTGGVTGMSGIIAGAAWLFSTIALTRAALWIALVGTLISTVLLIADLGRPLRFLHMLRVFKIRSPMSVGSWILSSFGGLMTASFLGFELSQHRVFQGWLGTLVLFATILAFAGMGFFGMFLATYTGVLIGATVIPAWNLHHVSLPIHFGTVALGAAAGTLELLGFREPALSALGLAAAGMETLLWILLEIGNHGAADRAVHHGRSGWMIRIADLCTGPLALGARLLGLVPVSALIFCAGGMLSRFGWIAAGDASGRDPAAVLAAQQR